MENEIMDYEGEAMEPEVEIAECDSERTGIGTGVAMLIGAGLTLAVTAAVKFGKKQIAKLRAKKAVEEADAHDFVTVDDEEGPDVAK